MTLHVSEMNVVGDAESCGSLLKVTASLSASYDDQIRFDPAGAQLGERRDGNVEALVVVKTSDADQAVQRRCVFLGAGRNAIRLSPALVLTRPQADTALEILDASLTEVESSK